MSKTGGYQIIDLKNKNLTATTTATVKGIYSSIESNYRKALLLSGIVIDGVEKADVFTYVTLSGTIYNISVYGRTITITDDDKVNINTVK